MIEVRKEEVEALRNRFGDSVSIATVNKCKGGKRKKYYMCEEPRFVAFLDRLRSSGGKNGC